VRKLSADKETLPGPKQVFRRFEDGKLAGDVVVAEDETVEGEPLLVPFMEGRRDRARPRRSSRCARRADAKPAVAARASSPS